MILEILNTRIQATLLLIHQFTSLLTSGLLIFQLIIACKKGGTSIEDLAEQHPELIVKVTIYTLQLYLALHITSLGPDCSCNSFVLPCVQVPIDVFTGITDEDAAKVVDGLSPTVADRNASIEQVKKLYELFCKCDCTMLEVSDDFSFSKCVCVCFELLNSLFISRKYYHLLWLLLYKKKISSHFFLFKLINNTLYSVEDHLWPNINF